MNLQGTLVESPANQKDYPTEEYTDIIISLAKTNTIYSNKTPQTEVRGESWSEPPEA